MSLKPQATPSKIRRKSQARQYTPIQRCEAVLSVWTERRNATQVCRELAISYTVLASWQDVALEAMLKALEPKRSTQEALPALTPRLEKLLRKKGTAPDNGILNNRLARRLSAVREEPKT